MGKINLSQGTCLDPGTNGINKTLLKCTIKKIKRKTQQILEQRHNHDCICLRHDLTGNSDNAVPHRHTPTALPDQSGPPPVRPLSASARSRLDQTRTKHLVKKLFLPSLLSLSSSCPRLSIPPPQPPFHPFLLRTHVLFSRAWPPGHLGASCAAGASFSL